MAKKPAEIKEILAYRAWRYGLGDSQVEENLIEEYLMKEIVVWAKGIATRDKIELRETTQSTEVARVPKWLYKRLRPHLPKRFVKVIESDWYSGDEDMPDIVPVPLSLTANTINEHYRTCPHLKEAQVKHLRFMKQG